MFSSLELADCLESVRGVRVLVIGDAMLDRYVSGDVDRISPESPVPVLTERARTAVPGGAANVALNLADLGAEPCLLSVTGEDSDRGELLSLLRERGVGDVRLIPDPSRPTTVKTRFLSRNQQLLRSDREKTHPLSDSLSGNLLEQAAFLLAQVQALVLSDYGKGVLTPDLLRNLIDLARARAVPVLVDPKGSDYSRYQGASVVTPNRKELAEASGNLPTERDEDITEAAQSVLRGAGIDAMVATRSRDGMSIVRRTLDGTGFHAPCHLRTAAQEVYDVSGAGDTVIATLAAALAAGQDLLKAAGLANAAAGLVVAKTGTATVRPEELYAALLQKERHGVTSQIREEEHIFGRDHAREHVRNWRKYGLRIGFTNGCFDILHKGHVSYLRQARSRCDRLIVGLNCDASVRRLKGEGRPVNGERSRAEVLASLDSVDMVVLFGDRPEEQDTPLSLIADLRPDLLIKGQDYTVETVVGADLVQSWGGEVWLAPIEEGHSTTGILRKIAQSA